MNIDIIFAPSAELALQDEQGIRPIEFPVGWIPSVGDEFALYTRASNRELRFVCIKRLWNFAGAGENAVELTLDLLPDD